MKLGMLLLLSLTVAGDAQQEHSGGTVAGHVLLTDLNVPARLVEVQLMRMPDASSADAPAPRKIPTPPFYMEGTDIHGAFVFQNVAPGTYYLTEEMLTGYTKPDAGFSEEERHHPTTAVLERMNKNLPVVTVAADKTSRLDLSLHRGGAITGTIRYDDGALCGGARPMLQYRKDAAGTWSDWDGAQLASTDDLGRFRVAGLMPGEYKLRAELAVLGGAHLDSRSTVTVYSPDVFESEKAKVIKVGEGEESTNNDLTILVSRMHVISGALVDSTGGHTINRGKVTLYRAGEKAAFADAGVEDDLRFHFDFVPEGHYVVRVNDAGDVTKQTVAPPRGFEGAGAATKEIVVQSYGSYEGALDVLGDRDDLILTIPPKSR